MTVKCFFATAAGTVVVHGLVVTGPQFICAVSEGLPSEDSLVRWDFIALQRSVQLMATGMGSDD